MCNHVKLRLRCSEYGHYAGYGIFVERCAAGRAADKDCHTLEYYIRCKLVPEGECRVCCREDVAVARSSSSSSRASLGAWGAWTKVMRVRLS